MSSTDVIVRSAQREDVPQIMKLVRELAEFEKMPNAVKIDEKILERDGFDTNPPPFIAYVAEDKAKPGVVIGYAICNIGYAIWLGKSIYLEDFIVTESHRGKGVGAKIFSHVCKEALKLGCVVMNFVMLDWNPAGKFYEKMGAEDITKKYGWRYHILKKECMEKVAARIEN